MTFQHVRHVLLQCGWSPDRLTSTASKTFLTACAPKDAVLYVHPNGTLKADYQSEGRNALATHIWLIDDNDPSAIEEQIVQIDKEICDAVDTTYARRLWLRGVRPRQVLAASISAS